MKFNSRQTDGPVVCGAGPVALHHLSPLRIYRRGERVSLRSHVAGIHEELNAEVVGMNGESVLVLALHPYFVSPTECNMKAGDEFEVSRDQVFNVLV
jgi:hypothetical protein